MRITVLKGDITKLKVDAIVNAANTGLSEGGGVCGAIFNAAGPKLVQACSELRHCDTGDAVLTEGFDLPARYIIHAVGPIYHTNPDGAEELLKKAYVRSLLVGVENGIRRIAFPCISTGIYGFPKVEAAEIAVSAVREFVGLDPKFDEIIFCCFENEDFEIYGKILERR